MKTTNILLGVGKPIVTQFNKFPAVYETQRVIKVLTRDRN